MTSFLLRVFLTILLFTAIQTASVYSTTALQTGARVSVGNQVMTDQLKSSDEAAVKAAVWQVRDPQEITIVVLAVKYLLFVLVFAAVWSGNIKKALAK